MALKSKKLDVMFYEVYEEEQKLLKDFLSSSIRVRYTSKTIQEFRCDAPPARLISVRTQSRIPFAWAEGLSGILARTQGYDHLMDYQKKTSIDIPCGYLGAYCSRAVAEHAMMSMMVLLRKTKKQIKHFDTFSRDGLTGNEFCSRRALVIGVGNIGAQIVRIAQGLSMEVKGVDITQKLKKIKYVSLKQGVAWADVIFCALPLTDKTNGLLDYSLLKNMKPKTLFINISRGEISPIKDLQRLLSQGILGGLSLDVYEDERSLADYLRGIHPQKIYQSTKIILQLKNKDNVLLTPHNAFNTQEALREKARMTVQSVRAFLKTKRFPYPVMVEK